MPIATIRLSGQFVDSYPTLSNTDGYPAPTFVDLPGNRQFIIEAISAMVSLANFSNNQSATLTLTATAHQTGATIGDYQIPLLYQARYNAEPTNPASSIRDWWSANFATSGYVPWGGRLTLSGWRGPSDEGPGDADVTISGHYETAILINFPWVPFP